MKNERKPNKELNLRRSSGADKKKTFIVESTVHQIRLFKYVL